MIYSYTLELLYGVYCCCSEAELVCEMCAVLASGLMRPWVPRANTQISSTSASPTKGKKGPSGAKKGKTSGNLSQLDTDPNSLPYLKEALEVRT